MRIPRVWEQNDEHIQVSVGSVFYAHTLSDVRPANITSMMANLDAFVRESEGLVGCLFHVVAGAVPPSSHDRARTTEMFNRHATRLSGVAVVIEAIFPSALLRSAVTMVFDMTRREFDTRTFEDVVPASEWLAPKQAMSASEIVTTAAEARAALSEGRAPRW